MLTALLIMLREGFEADEDGWAVLVGGLVGLAAASVLGALVVLGGRRLPMRQFFTVSGLVLIVFAAGLVSRTVEQVVAYLAFLVTVAWLFLRGPRPARAGRA